MMVKLLSLWALSFFHPGFPVDSLGNETVDGKTYVIHKVDDKETLFSIARRYNTTVDAIKEINEGTENLEIGRILRVPYEAMQKQASNGLVHRVEEKETLYSISRKYNVSVEDLLAWNKLTGQTLSVGQELVIKKPTKAPTINTPGELKSRKGIHTVAPSETLFSIAKQYGISVDQLKAWNNLQGNDLKIGQTLMVASPEYSQQAPIKKTEKVQATVVPVEPVKKVTEQNGNTSPPPIQEAPRQTITITEGVKNADEVIESGLAELIEGTDGSRKYLALHRTVPIGTILKIRNDMNGREVFVRVMGKLQDTAPNEKLIIKISKSAYDRLGAIDSRFRVEITYYKNVSQGLPTFK